MIPYYDTREDLMFSCDTDLNYVMFTTRFEELNNRIEEEPVFKISRYNSDLMYIYEMR